MRIGPVLVLALLLPIVLVQAEPAPGDLLATAFERIDAKDERFEPYSFLYEVHTWIRDGDDELEDEDLERGRITGFSPDSTETEVLEERKVFSKDADSDGEEPKHEGRPKEEGEDDGNELPELDAEFRARHDFRFDEWTVIDGLRAAHFKIRPEKKKKENWKGSVWFAEEKGRLLALDLEPAKRPFGLKGMRVRAEYEDFGDRDLPTTMDMDVEVKVPIIVHKKIRVEMRFSEFELLVQ